MRERIARSITATDLCIGYRTHKGEKKVHEHLSFGLYPGELTSLLGANGAGKSTLLRTLSASQPSLAGDLQLIERLENIGSFASKRAVNNNFLIYEITYLTSSYKNKNIINGII